ncbi:MAG: hypothetical protein ABIQ70_13430 [Dokdonella sp.]
MASIALGGILSGLMKGYDQQNELNAADEKEKRSNARQDAADARQKVVDAQHDTSFTDSQADRAHSLERRPVIEGQEDQYNAGRLTGQEQNNAIGAHTIERLPTTDQQHDAEFSLGQQQKRAQIAAEGMRMRTEGMQQQLASWGIDDKRLQRGVQAAQLSLGKAYNNYQQTGDPSSIKAAYNSTAGIDGRSIDTLKKNKDGSFTIQMEGEDHPATVQDDQHLLAMMTHATDPMNYIQSVYNNQKEAADQADARAKNPKNFSELIRKDDGTLQNVDYGSNKTADVTGPDGKPVSGTLAGKNRDGTPTQIAAEFYREQMKNNPDGPSASHATADFMNKAYPNATGWWSPKVAPTWGSDGEAPPPSFARDPAAAAPAPRAAAAPTAQRQVVRRGMHNGQAVVQYSDGSVEPAQ